MLFSLHCVRRFKRNYTERTYFSNILYWGAFVVSGHGGNIHHPDLSGDEERAKADLNKGTREFQDDPELSEALH